MQVFLANNTNAIAATATSLSRAFPTGGVGSSCAYHNAGPGLVFVVTGPAAIVAVLPTVTANTGLQGNATPIPVGASVNITHVPSDSFWAAICLAAGTATVYCTPGEGL